MSFMTSLSIFYCRKYWKDTLLAWTFYTVWFKDIIFSHTYILVSDHPVIKSLYFIYWISIQFNNPNSISWWCGGANWLASQAGFFSWFTPTVPGIGFGSTVTLTRIRLYYISLLILCQILFLCVSSISFCLLYILHFWIKMLLFVFVFDNSASPNLTF